MTCQACDNEDDQPRPSMAPVVCIMGALLLMFLLWMVFRCVACSGGDRDERTFAERYLPSAARPVADGRWPAPPPRGPSR